VTSGDSVSVARCRYCGKEFDVRRFQVVVMGSRGVYDSTECALLDDDRRAAMHPKRVPAFRTLTPVERR
jgi:hypothetical protein